MVQRLLPRDPTAERFRFGPFNLEAKRTMNDRIIEAIYGIPDEVRQVDFYMAEPNGPAWGQMKIVDGRLWLEVYPPYQRPAWRFDVEELLHVLKSSAETWKDPAGLDRRIVDAAERTGKPDA
jgi:hypothetical protein